MDFERAALGLGLLLLSSLQVCNLLLSNHHHGSDVTILAHDGDLVQRSEALVPLLDNRHSSCQWDT